MSSNDGVIVKPGATVSTGVINDPEVLVAKIHAAIDQSVNIPSDAQLALKDFVEEHAKQWIERGTDWLHDHNIALPDTVDQYIEILKHLIDSILGG